MLTVSDHASSLAPAPGVTPPPTDGATYRFLSDVILARGLVPPTAMKAALQASLAGRSLTEILVDHGHLSEDDLARTLAEHHRLDYVDLEEFAVDHEVAALIEPDVAARFGAVPIARLPSGTVVVALHDPNGSTAALEFARLTGHPIQPAVASRSQIKALIASLRRDRLPSPAADPAELSARTLPAASAVGAAAPTSERSEYPWTAPAAAPDVQAADRELEATRLRLADAERSRDEARERARSADELTRLAEARARAAEERAQAAGERVEAAEARGDTMSSTAGAASDTLMRLVHACEVLERESMSRGPEIEALRIALEAERSQRVQLDMQLRYAAPAEQLRSLQLRVAELERRLGAGPAEAFGMLGTVNEVTGRAAVEVAAPRAVEEVAEAATDEASRAEAIDVAEVEVAQVAEPATEEVGEVLEGVAADAPTAAGEDVAEAGEAFAWIVAPPVESPHAGRRGGLFGRRRHGA